jgi:hypothetical protein
LHAVSTDADCLKNHLSLFHPLPGPKVSLVEATISFHTSHDIHPVCSFFKGPEKMKDVHLAGARDPDYPDRVWILKAHGTCQVRGGVSSEVAAECHNNRFKFFHYPLSSYFSRRPTQTKTICHTETQSFEKNNQKIKSLSLFALCL